MRPKAAARIEQQHTRGRLSARERIAVLLDAGSFQELGALATHSITDFGLAEQHYPGDGVVTGCGKINGRRVAVFAHDLAMLGGSFSEVQGRKIYRIQEGVRSLAADGEVFVRNVTASGVVPQISLILGLCAGGADVLRCSAIQRREAGAGGHRVHPVVGGAHTVERARQARRVERVGRHALHAGPAVGGPCVGAARCGAHRQAARREPGHEGLPM